MQKPPGNQSFQGVFNFKAASRYSPTLKRAVPSPQRGLTSVFGMGTGVSLSLKTQPNQDLATVSNIQEQSLEKMASNLPLNMELKDSIHDSQWLSLKTILWFFHVESQRLVK